MSRRRNAGQNHDMKIADRSFVNGAKFEHLGTKVSLQHLIHEEVKSSLNSDNACYNSFQMMKPRRMRWTRHIVHMG
ncbi:hypothetical protein B7P43_G05904 [Cryptotermes secundus]|uniref:Uncharacterized protein n=1 Tax=Cryptotermes secundus TaxID=105785 RepID=A0A2J7RIH5_9NEOP|nr:hypothetical protein B7P43_G05904 [Cryptotermes secundus]